MPHLILFGRAVGRLDSVRDRPWDDLNQLVQLARDCSPLFAAGTQPDQFALLMWRSGGLANQGIPRLQRLMLLVADEINQSPRRSEVLRQAAAIFPGFLLDRLTHTPVGRIREPGLTDSHLHFGAAIAEADLLNGILRLKDAGGLATLQFDDRDNRRVSLAKIASLLRRLAVTAQFGLDDVILRREFWVGGVDLVPDEDHPAGSPRERDLLWDRHDPDSSIRVVRDELDVRRLVDVILTGSSPGWSPQAIDGALSLLCLAHLAVSSPERSSLDQFVNRFRTASTFAKIGLSQEDRFNSAIRWAGEGLERMELRKTYMMEDASSIEKEIEDDLASLIAAVRALPRTIPVVQMPLTLHKSTKPAMQSWRTVLTTQIAIARGIARYIYGGGLSVERRGLVASVDVVGREDAQPNWIIVAAFNRMVADVVERFGDPGVMKHPGANRYPIEVSAHAGESYSTPLTGMRAVREYVDNVPWLVRIGHGLALGRAAALRRYETIGPRIVLGLDVLENAAWVAHELGGSIFDPLDLAALDGLTSQLFEGLITTFAEAREWYRLRFDDTFLSNLVENASIDDPDLGLPDGVRSPIETAFYHYVAERVDGLQRSLGELGFDDSECRHLLALDRRLYELSHPQTVKVLNSRRIYVEVCPSSNAALSGLPLEEHPLLEHVSELLVTISTDDPAVFGSRVLEELDRFSRYCGPGVRESLRRNGADTAAHGVEDSIFRELQEL